MILTYIELKKQQDKLWLFSFNALNVQSIFNKVFLTIIVFQVLLKDTVLRKYLSK